MEIELFSQKLKKYRKIRKLTQLDLEIESNLAFGVVSRIEHSKISPSKETLFKLAKALHLNQQESVDLFCIEEVLKSPNIY